MSLTLAASSSELTPGRRRSTEANAKRAWNPTWSCSSRMENETSVMTYRMPVREAVYDDAQSEKLSEMKMSPIALERTPNPFQQVFDKSSTNQMIVTNENKRLQHSESMATSTTSHQSSFSPLNVESKRRAFNITIIVANRAQCAVLTT